MKRFIPFLLFPAALLVACGNPGCLRGPEGDCTVLPVCEELAFTCEDGFAEVYILEAGDPVPIGGQNALAATGDVVLGNDKVVAVLDALDHPHYGAPTGGSLLDVGRRGFDDDALRNMQQSIGVLPYDAFNYTEVKVIEEGDVKAVQFRGALDGYPEVKVATRYEVRPCDPGIRIRTEIIHKGYDPLPLWLMDVFYWGGREHLAFTPGDGFDHPSIGLSDLKSAFREIPWMAGAVHAGNAASYGVTSCNNETIRGFQSEEVSALGMAERILQPRDWEAYERFVAVASGPSASGPADLLLEVRKKLYGEPWSRVVGRLVPDDGGPLGDMVRASIVVSDDDGAVTHTVPNEDGTFRFGVPDDGSYTLSVEAFGMEVAVASAEVGSEEVDLEDIAIPGAGVLTLEATIDGQPDHVYAFVHPADDHTEDNVIAALHGRFVDCAPLLGNPWGPSPACNRVLIDGPTEISVPDGDYDIYASAGPFTTLARVAGVSVPGGTGQSVLLELDTLAVQPAGTLSADFHVHGRASFDSSVPDHDRVRAFLAARIDVVVSTDHDVVHDYADAMEALQAHDRMALIVGLETTGHILWDLREDDHVPRVIGHFNFWPMPFDPEGAWRGGPWDELAEPGELFTRAEEMGWPRQTGIIQLNHPWGGLQFGRDFAWPTSLGLDLTQPLPRTFDGSGQSQFLRTPEGAAFSNADYHTQEVMNGTNNWQFQQYRAIWHYLLNEGVVRAGTANSDSHSLVDNILGTPRTLVWADTTLASFDDVAFNQAVRDGRMMGTNGPVITAEVRSTTDAWTPSVTPFDPGEGAVLHVEVDAAPWVPVEQVRIYVNGVLVTLVENLPEPADPFGTLGIERLNQEFELSTLLPDSGDAWIVIEAGAPLIENADLDCNGVPDTGDNNEDGTIDWRDVEDLEEDPETGCLDTVGPLREPDRPERDTRAFTFERVTPGGIPTSFTNPFLLDRDGDGEYTGVPR